MEFLNKFLQYKNNVAFIYNGIKYSYEWLHTEVTQCVQLLDNIINFGDTVELCADYSPKAIAMFIALANKKTTVVPLVNIADKTLEQYDEIINPNARITISAAGEINLETFGRVEQHHLIKKIAASNSAGLIIMSSGSSGRAKAIVHSLDKIINSQTPTKSHKTVLTFLLFDHIGGINAMLNALVNGNTLVLPVLKDVNSIAKNIEKSGVEVLITSPSFLNLLVISESWKEHNLSSLKHINYGSEVMPESLLAKLSEIFPDIKLSQSYGMSELGVVKTKSKNSTSLSIKIDENSSNYRVVDGKLEIKTKTTMLGYLNAPDPFTADGWIKTGDMVEDEGNGWIKILGRESDIINIGGLKVFPIEIENIILQIPQVHDVVVSGETNAILGNIVKAQILVEPGSNRADQLILIRDYCFKNMEGYKIPQKFEFVEQIAHSRRFKKVRNVNNH